MPGGVKATKKVGDCIQSDDEERLLEIDLAGGAISTVYTRLSSAFCTRQTFDVVLAPHFLKIWNSGCFDGRGAVSSS